MCVDGLSVLIINDVELLAAIYCVLLAVPVDMINTYGTYSSESANS